LWNLSKSVVISYGYKTPPDLGGVFGYLSCDDADYGVNFFATVVFNQFFTGISHGAGLFGVESVVFAAGHINARLVFGAALSDDDLSGFDRGAMINFDAQPLPGAVAAQPGGATSFLVCHNCSLFF